MDYYRVEFVLIDGTKMVDAVEADDVREACGIIQENYDVLRITDVSIGSVYIDPMDYDDGMTDAEADADTLRNIGWGTDEDYGYNDDY